MMESSSMDSFHTLKSIHIPQSDLEHSNASVQEQNAALEETLATIGNALGHASQMLDDLENDGMLGNAIKRVAADLAGAVGNVARDLDHVVAIENKNEGKKWARALLDDAHSQLQLECEMKTATRNSDSDSNIGKGEDEVEGECEGEGEDQIVPSVTEMNMSAARAVSELSEGEIIDAMAMTRTILLDIEDALINISDDDAEEIADVGLIVAKMFLWGLKNVHAQITPDMIASSTAHAGANNGTGMDIEILDDEDANANGESNARMNKARRTKIDFQHQDPRMRILWPPIGPAVADIASWGKESTIKNPILSIALAMTLWPAALFGAFIGGPILAADWCLQSSYEALREQPVMETAEKSAANLFNVGKFYFLISKLMLKQSLRVGKRQVERRGGIEKIAKDVGDWSIDRALHPVESAGMLWNSAKWSAGKVVEGVGFVKDAASGKIKVSQEDQYLARDGLY